MTFAKHARVSFGGSLVQGIGAAEIWNCSINVYTGEPAGEWLSDPQAYAEGISTPLSNWFKAPTSGMATNALLEYVKVNNITPEGRYAEAITHQHLYAPTVAGGVVQAGGAPAFCSVAYTWETGAARGPAHRGRMFPPNYTYQPLGVHVSSGTTFSAATAGKALLSLLLAKLDGTTLVSPVVVSKIGAAVRPILGCSVDDLYDTQRRRKNRAQSTRSVTI